ncbi:raptor N-terminal caspase like domain-containing protein [Hyaloraphidium curvatum]|nr:raptor N-terminal caspase like domain-containing protein [Hyaloraphidium curvatum]
MPDVLQAGLQSAAAAAAGPAMAFFTERRHETGGRPDGDHPAKHPATDWKMTQRLKTVSVALVLCLNIGIDPPDLVKTNPAAKLEAWVDPFSMPPQKALENIGRNLQQQYEVWQPRARYKLSLDPSVEETKKLCFSLRRNAKEERILFHYNGHGVPRPTPGGEIWVFNKNYTQYIPVSIYDIQTWLGSPCIFVYDCSNAGNILLSFNRFAEQRDAEALRQTGGQALGPSDPPASPDPAAAAAGTAPGATMPSPYVPFRECIQLAACGPTETLPMNPDLPADIFTCCLTTPIEIALRWFVTQNSLLTNVTSDMIMKIPGRLNDRRTPLGELNWIFTAITDTIAWNVLPHDLFKKLFRQDLMVAALFRNFLLAERIMRSYNCTPLSYPELPPTHQHPLWQAWDLAADMVLAQLPGLLAGEENAGPVLIDPVSPLATGGTAAAGAAQGAGAVAANTSLPPIANTSASTMSLSLMNPGVGAGVVPVANGAPGSGAPAGSGNGQTKAVEYRHSSFFAEQLTAFEVWLARGAISRKPPEQLPIVLQVLLSQVHRLRALMLLSRFLDLGPWAVNLALSVGIFPYVLKLLQSPAAELKPVLVFIWAKILAVDSSCQNDLLKDNGFLYFVNILASNANMPPIPNISEHRAMCCFILSVFCHDFRQGQQACLKANLLASCAQHLADPDPLLRQWAAICMAELWSRFPEAKWLAVKESVHEKLSAMLQDIVPEVRAGAMLALGTFFGDLDKSDQVLSIEQNVALAMLVATTDASPLVRREFLTTISKLVALNASRFVAAAAELVEEERKRQQVAAEDARPKGASSIPDGLYQASNGQLSVYGCLWKVLLNLAVDPHPEIATLATELVDQITYSYLLPTILDKYSAASQASAVSVKVTLADVEKRTPLGGSVAKPPQQLSGAQSAPELGLGMANGQRPVDGDAGKESAPFVSRFAPRRNLEPVVPAVAGYEARRRPGLEELARTWKANPSPIQSVFFEWCCEYFAEPQMKVPEVDDPGSVRYIEKQWRHQRNEKLVAQAQRLQPLAATRKLEERTRTLATGQKSVQTVAFHSYEPHLIAASDRDVITVWDWVLGSKLNVFLNQNPLGSRPTALRLINEDDVGLLAVGSDDGVLRIYRNYESPDKVELLTAWRSLTDVVPGNHNKGLVLEWQQSSGSFLISGDVRTVRVWDAEKELCVQDIPTRTLASVSSLSSDRNATALIVAGCTDGHIRIYDRRLAAKESMVGSLSNGSPVTGVFLQRAGTQELISGSASGEVKLWDLRYSKPSKTYNVSSDGEMVAMAVHDRAGLISCWSSSDHVVTMNPSGDVLGNIELDTRSQVPAGRPLAYHPHRLVLAAGVDDHVAIYTSDAATRQDR